MSKTIKPENEQVPFVDLEDKETDPVVEALLDKYLTTDKRKAFVREYLIDNNGTQAAIRAGYAKKGARQQASVIMSKSNIAKCLSKIRTARMNALNFGKEDLIAYRISVVESPTATPKDKAVAAAALQRIWGMEKNELNVNLNGNLAERMTKARSRRAK